MKLLTCSREHFLIRDLLFYVEILPKLEPLIQTLNLQFLELRNFVVHSHRLLQKQSTVILPKFLPWQFQIELIVRISVILSLQH